jgi:hypothetical protein
LATDPRWRATVEMSFGRWVARCPRPGCGNGESFGRCDDGTTGGLTSDGLFHCRNEHTPQGGRYDGCGLTCEADWPANLADLERLLLARPAPSSRNWQKGEMVADLMYENGIHGIVPTSVLETGEPVHVQNDTVTSGAIDASTERLEIEGQR